MAFQMCLTAWCASFEALVTQPCESGPDEHLRVAAIGRVLEHMALRYKRLLVQTPRPADQSARRPPSVAAREPVVSESEETSVKEKRAREQKRSEKRK